MATSKKQTNPPWGNEKCLENIKKLGGKPCPAIHCEEADPILHRVCHCLPPYVNGCYPDPTPGCCVYNASTPIFVAMPDGGCYCCCGGGVFAVPAVLTEKNENTNADELKKGDAIYIPGDITLKKWINATVAFVSHTAPSDENPQISIGYTDEKNKLQTLVVGARQLLLLPDQTFKEAQKLVPGFDKLVGRTGKELEITHIAAGTYTTFTTWLATSTAPASDPAGHLIVLNGVVAGDYALLLGIGAENLSPRHHELPNAGSAAYKNKYPHLN